eukprot:gene29036-38425_t
MIVQGTQFQPPQYWFVMGSQTSMFWLLTFTPLASQRLRLFGCRCSASGILNPLQEVQKQIAKSETAAATIRYRNATVPAPYYKNRFHGKSELQDHPFDLDFIYAVHVDASRSKRPIESVPDTGYTQSTIATNCISFYHGGVNEFDEGANSTGFPIGPTFYDGRLVPYGCWFSLAKGTGVFINTGVSIVVDSRRMLNKLFGLPCSSRDEKHYPKF